MSWYTHVYHSWADDNGDTLNLLFQKETSNPTPVEVPASADPFILKLPKKEKFETIRGSGAEINLISSTNMYLTNPGFVGSNPKEWRVVLTKEGTKVWFGWLERRMISEPYTEIENYPVKLYATDGFAYLDRIKYLQTNGQPYTGFKTQWEVIQDILGHWGLMDEVTYLFVGLSTSITGVSHSDTILHDTYVNTENYYDEDEQPMSCREVLNAILKPYGAFIQLRGTSLYITDVNSLVAGGTLRAYHPTFVYAGFTSAVPSSQDLNTIGIYETGAKLSTKPNFKGITVNYSPYKNDGCESHLDDHTNYVTQSSAGWTHDTSTNGWKPNDDYYKIIIESHSEWHFPTTATGPYRVLGLKQKEEDKPEYMLSLDNYNWDEWKNMLYGTVATASWTDGPFIVGDSDYYLRVKGKIRARTRTDPYNSKTGEENTRKIGWDAVKILCGVSVGNKSFSPNNEWVVTSATSAIGKLIPIYGGGLYTDGNAGDKWLDFCTLKSIHDSLGNSASDGYYGQLPETLDEGCLYSLDETVRGYVTLSFSAGIQGVCVPTDSDDQYMHYIDWTTKIRSVEIKDIKIDVVEKGTLSENDLDIEYPANIQNYWEDSNTKVQLQHGDSSVGTPIDRGGLLYDNSGLSWISSWTRQGKTAGIEELLCNSLVSNYSGSIRSLDITLNSTLLYPYITIKDDTYLSGITFFTVGADINPTRLSCKYQLEEIKSDAFTL